MYSLTAIRSGSSLSAHNAPSASTNRTRCRLGPTGMSRSGTSVQSQSPSRPSPGQGEQPGRRRMDWDTGDVKGLLAYRKMGEPY